MLFLGRSLYRSRVDILITTPSHINPTQGATPATQFRYADILLYYVEALAELDGVVKRHYGVRTERYKLIHFYNDIDFWELYDLHKDPQEMNHLYANPEYNSLIVDLKAELKRFIQIDP